MTALSTDPPSTDSNEVDRSSILTPRNIRFRYLYRDASNYMQHGEAIFTNRGRLSLLEIEKRIQASLHDGEFFIARQIHLEEFFFDTLYEDDHPWHEFAFVEATTDPVFDPENFRERGQRRDITEFLTDLQKAEQAGWDEMNVREDLKRQMEKQKKALKRTFKAGKDIPSGARNEQSQS